MSSIISAVPTIGPPIAAVVKTILQLIPKDDKLDAMNSEVRHTNVKLDTLKIDLTWETWAAGAYQKPVNNSEKSWLKYIELERSGQGKTPAEKVELEKNFFYILQPVWR